MSPARSCRCTVWEGVIYTPTKTATSASAGRRVDAPRKLIFPDLGYSLRMSSAYGANGFTQVPWDVFLLKGCQ